MDRTFRCAARNSALRAARCGRFHLRDHILFNTVVASADYQEPRCSWRIETGAVMKYSLKPASWRPVVCHLPIDRFDGIDVFEGSNITPDSGHTPVDFSGKRVGIIGTGSSAIQSIPIIAESAAHLTVFQRTANYSIPAHNGPIDEAYARIFDPTTMILEKETSRCSQALAQIRLEATSPSLRCPMRSENAF